MPDTEQCCVSGCNSEALLRIVFLRALGKVYIWLCQRHWGLYKNSHLMGERDL
jgi:hypothetical protein